MGMTWTDKQLDAINFEGKGTIVSAAAGSGKTAVLVERVKRILMDSVNRVSADKMVISTFTNDAAGEMKSRLMAAIEEELTKNPTNEYLEEQRIKLEDASICTISSFCMKLLRNNSALAGLEPGFKVIDESEGALILSEALKALLEDFCESGNAADRDLLYDRFAGENDEKLAKTISRLYEFWRSLPDPDAFFAKQLALYGSPDKPSAEDKANIDHCILQEIKEEVEDLNDLFAELKKACAGTIAANFPDEWKAMIDTLLKIKDLTSFTTNYAALKAIKKMPSPPRKTDNFDNSTIIDVNDKLKKSWKPFLQHMNIINTRSADMTTCAPILKILIDLVKKLDAEYTLRKREKNCVDFTDIELLTLKMLRGANGEPSETAKAIAQDIDVIIVDEFQDSNDIQYEIFRLISKDKKNLYFVGDIKQSIYAFRGADPLVFSRLTKDPDFEEIKLNMNFRSSKEVIDSVNGIFSGTMTDELGDVDYDKDDCALIQGAKYSTGTENRTELVTFGNGSRDENREAEAEYITARIKQMIASGFEVTDGDTKRPCRYGDFVVLMGRYSRYIGTYLAAFDKSGIPYEAKNNEDYTSFSEVKHALALLRVIDDPYRDIDLAAVLMKEPYLLSAEELGNIKLAGGTKNSSLWIGLKKYAETDEKAKHIYTELCSYRAFAEENSAERLIRRICDESMLIPAAQAAPDGVKRARNLHKLIHHAENFSGGESAGLCDFIKYMETINQQGIKLTQEKASSGTNAVRIMTIHGSKGLEFPICFVSNVISEEKKVSDEIVCDQKFGVGLKITDTNELVKKNTFMYDMVKSEILRRQRSEEMRLLYVAATRAKEKLIFTVPLTNRKPDMHYAWILKSKAVASDGLIDVINEPHIDILQTENEATSSEAEYILPKFTEYKYDKFCDIPAKVTATQVGVKSATDLSEVRARMDRFLRMPSFLSKKDKEQSKLSGKKRGDAYHKVMEHLDFNVSAEELPKILDGMCEKGILSDIERLTVDENDIAKFLASDICKRAAASGQIYREYPIFCEYDGAELGITDWGDEPKPFVQGVADMFFVENGEIVLVDYKTNRNVTKAILTEEYRGQLAIYANALSKAAGMNVKQRMLYSFEIGEVEVTS